MYVYISVFRVAQPPVQRNYSLGELAPFRVIPAPPPAPSPAPLRSHHFHFGRAHVPFRRFKYLSPNLNSD